MRLGDLSPYLPICVLLQSLLIGSVYETLRRDEARDFGVYAAKPSHRLCL